MGARALDDAVLSRLVGGLHDKSENRRSAMCLLCATDTDSAGEMARRLHVLRLLALVEHPDALPPDAALRLSREIMTLTGLAPGRRRCDPVAPEGVTGERP